MSAAHCLVVTKSKIQIPGLTEPVWAAEMITWIPTAFSRYSRVSLKGNPRSLCSEQTAI